MDLKKAYERVDKEALWSVLKMYGVGGQILQGTQAFIETNACMRVKGLICERVWKKGEYQMTGRKLSLYHCIKVKAVGVSVVAIGGQAY